MAQFSGFSSVAQFISGPIVFNPASVPANSTTAQQITVPGAVPGMFIVFSCATMDGDLAPVSAWVDDIDTVAVRFVNPTAAPIDEGAHTFYFMGL